MEYKLRHCDSCEHIISISDIQDKIYVCPICGCLNERNNVTKRFRGQIVITSDELVCETQEDEIEADLLFEDTNDEICDALMILVKYGWRMKFKGRIDNDDED